MVAFLVRALQEQGFRPGIVSRGYRSLAADGNDERRVLELLCPGVPHVQDADRVAAAREVSAGGACDVVVADDAFQHRRLGRFLDVVLIDGLNPFGFDQLLPRGLLREPVSGLSRADVVIMTRADQTSEKTRVKVWEQVARWRPEAMPIEVAFEACGLVGLDGASEVVDSLTGPVVAFCGIGNPSAFEQTLRDAGVSVAEYQTFPDHHEYTAEELASLVALARERTAGTLVTTLKDIVKLRGIGVPGIPIFALDIRAKVVRGSNELTAALNSIRR
jgi:tetraacyldisaccharide 4'-kinase